MMSIALSFEGRLTLAIAKGDMTAALAELKLRAAVSEKWAIALHHAQNQVDPPAPLPETKPWVLPVAANVDVGAD